MFKAYQNNKSFSVKTNGLEPKLSIRSRLAISEDVTTSMVFGRVLYLPDQSIWNLLVRSTFGMSAQIEEIECFKFWTKFGSKEPDLFIRFRTNKGLVDLIIEVKTTSPQSHVQWSEQLRSYREHKWSKAVKKTFFMALGGTNANFRHLRDSFKNFEGVDSLFESLRFQQPSIPQI